MRLSLLSIGVFLLPSLSGRADTFNVSATLEGYYGTVGSLSGTATIDTVRGIFEGADITATLDGEVYEDVIPGDAGPFCPAGTDLAACQYVSLGFATPGAGGRIDFDTSVTNGLVGYHGSGFCGGATADCQFSYFPADDDDYIADDEFGVNVFFITDGGLTPATTVATTPEPPGLMLLGTGAAGVLGTAWRQSRRRRSTSDL